MPMQQIETMIWGKNHVHDLGKHRDVLTCRDGITTVPSFLETRLPGIAAGCADHSAEKYVVPQYISPAKCVITSLLHTQRHLIQIEKFHHRADCRRFDNINTLSVIFKRIWDSFTL